MVVKLASRLGALAAGAVAALGCGDAPGPRDAAPCLVVDDDNDCTVDACVAGLATNLPVARGGRCASDGGAVCDGAGACVECATTADCEGARRCDPARGACVGCLDNADCGGGAQCVPATQTCAATTCFDGLQNQDETDVDCGGRCRLTRPCGPGAGCVVGADCADGVCAGGVCAAAATEVVAGPRLR